MRDRRTAAYRHGIDMRVWPCPVGQDRRGGGRVVDESLDGGGYSDGPDLA
ncbi:hypothetical protein KCH_68540 [Kitasatospora cheerisanensis KCTC 2395]|uniref:Uncharacterized protein n=1 Tax=Kitasatospora cheerisanensis KCTC 2395 TaxID=1348663 RepID=A0A066YJQ5_9ACTN|nr:hypothetical protein KCH_68540 [Kitasatospora cheerisanensis KCTC 2395]